MKKDTKYCIYALVFFAIVFQSLHNKNVTGESSKPESHDHSETAIPVTIWTEKIELFMEYPPLVKNEEAEFVVHLTDLSNFKPIAVGRIVMETTTPSGKPIKTFAPVPIKPGIFLLLLTFPESGTYEINMKVKSDKVKDNILLKNIVVYEDLNVVDYEHKHAVETNHEKEIVFLKEQQWMLGVKTKIASKMTLFESISTTAKVVPKHKAVAEITSPIPGKIVFDEKLYQIPLIGDKVRKGQTLAIINPLLPPSSIEFKLTKAKDRLFKADNDLKRASQLYESGAIPLKKLQETELNYKIEEANYENLLAQIESYKTGHNQTDNNKPYSNPESNYIYLNAPISGTIVSLNFSIGSHVDVQDKLFTVIDISSVWIEAQVYEHDIPSVLSSNGATFKIPGYQNEIHSIDAKTGKLVNIGVVIDEETRTVPAVYEVINPDMKLRIGMFLDFNILTKKRINTLAIPQTAILNKDSRNIAYVHIGGESFAKRNVDIGITDQGLTEIISGINPGERVVTTGVYQIKLASMTKGLSQGNGHAH